MNKYSITKQPSLVLKKLAATFGLKKPMDIIIEVQEAIANWKQYAKNSNVSSYTDTTIEKRIQELLRL